MKPQQQEQELQLLPAGLWLGLAAAFLLMAASIVWAVTARIPVVVDGYGIVMVRDTVTALGSPRGGVIIEMLVKPGDVVAPNQRIALIQVDGAPSPISSAQGGVVVRVLATVGTPVQNDAPLIWLAPKDDPNRGLVANLFVSSSQAKRVRNDMKVLLEVDGYSKERHGYLTGQTKFVASMPSLRSEVEALVGGPELASAFLARFSDPPTYARIDLNPDTTSPTGFNWTTKDPGEPITPGALFKAYVIIDENRPIDYVLPFFERILWER